MGKAAKVVLGLAAIVAPAFIPFLGSTFLSIGTWYTTLGSVSRLAGGFILGSLLKPRLPELSQEFGREIQLSGDPIAPRKILYGEQWTSGVLRGPK